MATVGERLRAAIKDSEHQSVRQFHRVMNDRGVKGSSYAMVHRYLQGKAEPSLTFLREAAEVLGVLPEWLTSGAGERVARDRSEPTVDDLMLKAAPFIMNLGPRVWAIFHEAISRLLWACPEGPTERAPEDMARLAAAFERIVLEPWLKVGKIPPVPGHRQLTDYTIAALHAAMLAMPPMGEGRSFSDLIAHLEGEQ